MNVYWDVEPSVDEQRIVDAWIKTHYTRDISVIAIGPTTVVAFGSEPNDWGTSEMREPHGDVPAALDALMIRFRSGQAPP